MKIRISKSTDKILGSLRVSNDVYNKIEAIAKKKEVSKQEVVRAILDEAIDKIEF
jgi:predicted DNA-binding protein